MERKVRACTPTPAMIRNFDYLRKLFRGGWFTNCEVEILPFMWCCRGYSPTLALVHVGVTCLTLTRIKLRTRCFEVVGKHRPKRSSLTVRAGLADKLSSLLLPVAAPGECQSIAR